MKIDYHIPPKADRDEEIIRALISLHTMLGAAMSGNPRALEDPRIARSILGATAEWAQAHFPDVTFTLKG